MKHRLIYISLFLAGGVAASLLVFTARSQGTMAAPTRTDGPTWSPQLASRYLDSRETYWQHWPAAKRDHGTICVSCHTVVPYAMVRSTMESELREQDMPAPEKVMLANVEKRVQDWPEVASFYSDAVDGPGKTAQSRSTEAVLNAVILASMDAQNGKLMPITRKAFDEAWALQETTGPDAGAWKWEDFNLAPWESAESAYQGAALFLLALENTPDKYAMDSANSSRLVSLEGYLRDHYAGQPLVNQLYILWLSPKVTGLLSSDQQKTLFREIVSEQNADGGWSLASLDPGNGIKQRLKRKLLVVENEEGSDGYATALVVLALEQSGMSRSNAVVAGGLDWLKAHQAKDGSWRAYSLNERRDPQSNIGRFMSDAATAYAVMALENKR